MKPIYKSTVLAAVLLAVLGVPGAVFAQSGTSVNSEKLQNALRRIARNSNNSSALADAGMAALELGDTRAAIGFLARADQIYPRSGRVKLSLARALLLERNPFGALRYFKEAAANGISVGEIAADRGLAYDLIGRNRDAQKDYQLAMRTNRSDELLSRYAISLGISGDLELSDAALNPLLQKSDRDAWRHRAFILAMNGKNKGANQIARQTMRGNMAKAIEPFLDRMPKLTAAQKAAAVHFGHFPASENIGVDVASVRYASNTAVRGGDGADAGLIPLGVPLGGEFKRPRVLAMPNVSPRRRPGKRRSSRKAKSEISQPKNKEIVRLSRTDLPAPSSARPLVKPKVARANETVGSKPKPVFKAKPVIVKKDLKPGFETALTSGSKKPIGESIKVAVAQTPSAITSAMIKKPSSRPPLISESVTRKVAIGGRSVPQPSAVKAKPSVTQRSEELRSTSTSTPPQIIKKPAEIPPIDLVSFDLAKANNSPPASQKIASITPARKSLADIIGSISIPDKEKDATVVPVDLDKITPAKPKPKKKVEAKAEPKKEKAEPKKPKHPKRYWVQIATGSKLSALKYDFRRMAKKHGGIFKGKSAWTSPWGRTRRLVVGSFDSLSAAKKFEKAFRKGGGDGFAWVSAQGTEVNKLTK